VRGAFTTRTVLLLHRQQFAADLLLEQQCCLPVAYPGLCRWERKPIFARVLYDLPPRPYERHLLCSSRPLPGLGGGSFSPSQRRESADRRTADDAPSAA
jgi:hypothetical protein